MGWYAELSLDSSLLVEIVQRRRRRKHWICIMRSAFHIAHFVARWEAVGMLRQLGDPESSALEAILTLHIVCALLRGATIVVQTVKVVNTLVSER